MLQLQQNNLEKADRSEAQHLYKAFTLTYFNGKINQENAPDKSADKRLRQGQTQVDSPQIGDTQLILTTQQRAPKAGPNSIYKGDIRTPLDRVKNNSVYHGCLQTSYTPNNNVGGTDNQIMA